VCDGLQLCIGTENGSVGTLDIATHKYATILRSHTDSVNALAVDGSGKHLLTASSDGTIRIWDLATHQQLCALIPPRSACLVHQPWGPHTVGCSSSALARAAEFDRRPLRTCLTSVQCSSAVQAEAGPVRCGLQSTDGVCMQIRV
jgi:WD repeat-containing protein 90